ncbi:MAG TPA: HlyD family efflux transporter periplasmic adaptor subunit [Terriglobia bacterium]|nr:HlyD family efflux transporter periplasmic adaptor subunit [Terriglobia bacterium]
MKSFGLGPWIQPRIATEGAPGSSVDRPHLPPPHIAPRTPRERGLYVITASIAAVAIVVGLWAWHAREGRRIEPAGRATISAVKVERRTFVRTLRLSGTVEAVVSYSVLAPRLTGGDFGQMILTKLTRGGTRVKKGDLLAEFDREAQLKNFIDKQAEHRDLENQIESKKAEQEAGRAHDDTELKQAEDAVGTARLEVQRSEVVSRIDAEKNKLNLEAAEASLKQLRQTYDLKRKADVADLRLLEIKRDRARSAMLHAKENSEKMAVLSPIDGLVVLNATWKGGGMGEVEEGDQVYTGLPFMQVVDPSTMQVRVRVNQLDVPFLHIGQTAQIHLDAYPDLTLPGKLEQLAAIGLSTGLSKTVRTFGGLFSMQGSDARLMPDLSASLDVVLGREPNALVVPREAVVRQGGKTWVYVKRTLGFERQAIKTGDEDDLEIVVLSGLEAGMEVERNPEPVKSESST